MGYFSARIERCWHIGINDSCENHTLDVYGTVCARKPSGKIIFFVHFLCHFVSVAIPLIYKETVPPFDVYMFFFLSVGDFHNWNSIPWEYVSKQLKSIDTDDISKWLIFNECRYRCSLSRQTITYMCLFYEFLISSC